MSDTLYHILVDTVRTRASPDTTLLSIDTLIRNKLPDSLLHSIYLWFIFFFDLRLNKLGTMLFKSWRSVTNIEFCFWFLLFESNSNSLFLTIGRGEFLVHHTIPNRSKLLFLCFFGRKRGSGQNRWNGRNPSEWKTCFIELRKRLW